MPAASSPRSRSTALSTAPRSRKAFANGRARRPMISCSRSRRRAMPPTAACWPRRLDRAVLRSGVLELKAKLGPILWQFHPAKKFDADDFEAFLALLPRESAARRSATPSRSATRASSRLRSSELTRKFSVAIVLAESAKHPLIADVTGDFYLRLQRTSEKAKTGHRPRCSPPGRTARRAWAAGGAPDDLPDHRRDGAGEAAARRVRLHDRRRQGARRRPRWR